jgi:hypothetical protein
MTRPSAVSVLTATCLAANVVLAVFLIVGETRWPCSPISSRRK